MSSPAAPIMIGLALLLLTGGKKKKKRALSVRRYTPSVQEIPNIYGDLTLQGATESPTTWEQRQQALTALSQIEINLANGTQIRLCPKCDPKGVSGAENLDTQNAIKSFQALNGLDVTGEWGILEDKAMHQVLGSIAEGEALGCDPLHAYPDPFACFANLEGDFYLAPVAGTTGEPVAMAGQGPQAIEPPEPPPSESAPQWGPDDIIVADAECDYILHQSQEFFDIQKRMIISYALDGMTDGASAHEIHELMMAEYLPLCLTLGRDSVGSGVAKWWDTNVAHVFSELHGYELVPDLLEQDAIEQDIPIS